MYHISTNQINSKLVPQSNLYLLFREYYHSLMGEWLNIFSCFANPPPLTVTGSKWTARVTKVDGPKRRKSIRQKTAHFCLIVCFPHFQCDLGRRRIDRNKWPHLTSNLTSYITSTTIDRFGNRNSRISSFGNFGHEIIIYNGIFRNSKDIVDLSKGLISNDPCKMTPV